jgi:hypothetical protein
LWQEIGAPQQTSRPANNLACILLNNNAVLGQSSVLRVKALQGKLQKTIVCIRLTYYWVFFFFSKTGRRHEPA